MNYLVTVVKLWAVTPSGKGLRSPRDLDELNQLRQVFDRRIALSKRN